MYVTNSCVVTGSQKFNTHPTQSVDMEMKTQTEYQRGVWHKDKSDYRYDNTICSYTGLRQIKMIAY